ncbi:MAG: hypothetical protein ACP5KN_17320, partial [Armatimonadota bacterium]
MALVNPGLGDGLLDCVSAIVAKESDAGGDTASGRAEKQVLSRHTMLLGSFLERGDGTNALDYDDAQRSDAENYYKRLTVGMTARLLERLESAPERTWPEVGELAQILSDLTTTEDTSWRREIVRLGQEPGVTVELRQTIGGSASFNTPGGTVTAQVYEARSPDVALNEVDVYLLEMLPDEDEEEP